MSAAVPCGEGPVVGTAAPGLAVGTRLAGEGMLTGARFAPEGAAGHRRPADCPSRAMKEIGMTTRRMAIVAGVAVLLAIAIALATCSGNTGPDGESAQAAAAGSGAADDAAARGTADATGAFELTPDRKSKRMKHRP